ncbi:MAG: D-alanyl-D-alanine carboxypeptidase [Gammaproteobacteria bacterium]|nr:D-alanyl-D-alanine carboxypeptidase [Gammaproteobacteria bacterium]
MKPSLRFSALILFGWLLCDSLSAQTASRIKPPLPDPPRLSASSYLLQDFNSATVLVQHNADARVEPASITKVMTAYVVFHELQAGKLALDDLVTVSEKAWRKGGSKMFIEVGDKVLVEDLLRGMIVQSGNDASIALAEAVAGSEAAFASVMNGYAAQLGMQDSHFVNATGWPHEDHYTTAADLARLARAMIQEFPDFYGYFAEREFSYGGIEQPNRNRLLLLGPGVDGLKTGHTEAAGYCLLASAEQDGMRLISVVMGTESEQQRNDQSLELLVYGQRFFTSMLVQQGQEPIGQLRIWKGAQDTVAVQVSADIHVAVPRSQVDDVRTVVRVQQPLLAPLAAGDEVGRLQVLLADSVIAEYPLQAADDVAPAGLMTRWWHGMRLWMGAGDAATGADD